MADKNGRHGLRRGGCHIVFLISYSDLLHVRRIVPEQPLFHLKSLQNGPEETVQGSTNK